MLRILSLALLLSVFCAGSAQATADCTYAGGDANGAPLLKRGINLSRWWEDDRRQALKSDDVKNLHTLGFDFVRLPLSPSSLVMNDESELKQRLAQLRCDIISLLNQNLAVIVDLHAPERFQRNLAQDTEAEATQHLENLWQRMLPVLAGLPPSRVLLGLYNEPQIEAEPWWRIQGQLVKNLRTVFPDNPMVVTAGPDGGPWNLERMQAYDDKNIIYDFHFYQPMQFTHHGADWLSSYKPGDKSVRITYPVTLKSQMDESNPRVKDYMATNWNRLRLSAYIDKATAWAKENNAKIACLEFGVFRPYVDSDSRAHWLADMRFLLERDHIPWAMWEYRGGFGLLSDEGAPDESVLKALNLKRSAAR